MRVGIVYSAHAEDEIDQVIFQAAYGNERYYNCMQNLASIIKALSSNPYNIRVVMGFISYGETLRVILELT